MKRYLLFAAFLSLALPAEVLAQCGCDHFIPAATYQWDGVTNNVQPGDKICFQNGTRGDVMITNVHGTAQNPVIITNRCDGFVKIQGPTPSAGRLMYMGNVSHVRVSGSGNTAIQYGIEMTVGIQGIDFRDLSTNVEADHLYVHDLSYSGINAKTDPTCDPATWRANFTMYDVKVHDNYVANVLGEGLYIGESHYHTTVTNSCGQQVEEHAIIGCQIYNNRLENIGRDGIQVGSVISGGSIHHNTVTNFGTVHDDWHASGIQMNPGTNAETYNNILDTGWGYGIFAGGRGGSHLYNNIIANCQMGGIICEDYAPVDPSGFVFANNTLVNNTNVGIDVYSDGTTQTRFVNNIIVGPSSGTFVYTRFYNGAASIWTESNNIKTTNISTVQFVNAAAKNYRLQSTSPARDAGANVSAYGISFDVDDGPRPLNTTYDIGAHEYGNTANAAPVANAGNDITVTLPATSTTISGSGIDSDGTITSYAWIKLTGGSVTLSNQNTATLGVSGLAEGNYSFRLTVTDNGGKTAYDDVSVFVNPPAGTVKSRFNFSNMVQNVAGWIDLVGHPHTGVITGTDAVTGISVNSVAANQWNPVQNATPASSYNGGVTDGTIQPAAVMLTQWLNFGSPYGSTVNGVQQGDNIMITGLNPAKTYKLQMGASRATGAAADRYGNVEYRVNGSDAKLLLVTDNRTLEVTYLSKTPNAQGNIGISARKVNGDSPMQFGYIGWLIVTENAASNVNPTANAGADKVITLPTTSTTFSGSGSDSDGTIASYAWTKVSGGSATLTNANTATLSVSGLAAGNYTFRLTVTDNQGGTGSDDVALKVNTAPTANAGANKVLYLPTNSTTFSGSGTDTDGTISTYAWTKVSGGSATLSNANTATLGVSGVVAGSYTFRLTVTDNNGATGSDDVLLTVNANVAPTVNAGADKQITLPVSTVTIAGSASDTGGTISTYAWTKQSGGAATLVNQNTATLTANSLVQGSYVFRLTVTDNGGLTAFDEVNVTVSPQKITKFNLTDRIQNVSGWVDAVGAPHNAVINVTDPVTGFSVSSIATNQWNPVQNATPASSYNGGVTNGTVQPAAVVQTHWFNYGSPYGSTVNGVVQTDNVRVSGLNPARQYKLQMGSSRVTGSAPDRYGNTEYRVFGINPQLLLVTNNATNEIVYNSVTPNASGQILIAARKVNGDSPMQFGYIGWLIVTDVTGNGARMSSDESETTGEVFPQEVVDENAFTFLDRKYASGYDYSVRIFNAVGDSVYEGAWSNSRYNDVFVAKGLYIYHILRNGKQVDAGKVYIVE